VNLTWVFFRARDFGTAWRMTRTMLGFGLEGSVPVLSSYLVAVVVAVTVGILVVHGFMRNRRLEQVVASAPWWLVGSVWAAMLFLILISQGSGHAFIYFQF
jgi:alginate O-acetyltransferase complex protein AlgI